MPHGSTSGKATRKRKKSPSPSGSQGSSHKKPARESAGKDQNETIDAILALVQDALKVAAACTSGLPIVGQVLPAVQALVDRVKDTRENVREKKDALEEIEGLIKAIQSIGGDVYTQLDTLTDAEKQDALHAVGESESLGARMDQIVTDLDKLKISVEERPKRSAVKQFFYVSSEKKFLEGVREKVAAIKENLQIRDRSEITGILTYIKENVRKQTILLASIEQYQRDQAAADVLEKLERAHGVSYRSRYVEEKAKLHPGTRKRILDEVLTWARSPSQDRRVQVIYGPAGAGKSAIARAVSEALAESGHLGASFFFLRGDPECSNPYLVFPTIAYQLAHSRPSLMTCIVDAVKRYTQDGQTQGIAHQTRHLFVNILRACVEDVPLVMVFDGIDECSNSIPEVVPALLQLICQATTDIPTIRILIATRPETHIMSSLPGKDDDSAILRNLWTDTADEIDEDIQMYIQAEVDQRERKGNFYLLEMHPDLVSKLTQLSAKLFIYASTVTSALLSDDVGANDMLDALLSDQGSSSEDIHKRLDSLCHTILTGAFGQWIKKAESLKHIHEVLVWFALLPGYSAEELKLVGIPPHITQIVISRLRSVLLVDGNVTPTTPLRACHASFPQFLTNPARCTDPAFLVDPPSGHALMATSLLDLQARDDVDSLRDANGHMPRMWSYANTYWFGHLCQVRYTPELGRALRGFVETHLEDWLCDRGAWGYSWVTLVRLVDSCANVRCWYEKSGPDDGLVEALDDFIDRRVKELVAEAAQSPNKFKEWELPRIKDWSAANGWVPDKKES